METLACIRGLSLPCLETLRISTDGLSKELWHGLHLAELPQLRQLIINVDSTYLLGLIPIYGAQLKRLSLKEARMNVDTWRSIVRFCHALDVLCICSEAFEGGSYESGLQIGAEVWEMKTLIRLELRECSFDLVTFIRHHVRFPNLRSFAFTLIPDSTEPVYFTRFIAGMVRST